MSNIRVIERQLLDARRAGRPRLEILPRDKCLRWWQRGDMAPACGVRMAAVELFADLQGLLLDLFVLRDEQPYAASGRQKFDDRNRCGPIEVLADGYDQHVIGLAGRSLRRRIEAADRLD